MEHLSLQKLNPLEMNGHMITPKNDIYIFVFFPFVVSFLFYLFIFYSLGISLFFSRVIISQSSRLTLHFGVSFVKDRRGFQAVKMDGNLRD